MSTRIFSAIAVLTLLAACGEGAADSNALAKAEADARAEGAEQGRIECTAAGEDAFRRDCTIERSQSEDGGLILTVSHPEGSFRRLRVVDDGRGVVAADGAEEAKVSLIDGGGIEVAIAGDRYRLPATIGAQ